MVAQIKSLQEWLYNSLFPTLLGLHCWPQHRHNYITTHNQAKNLRLQSILGATPRLLLCTYSQVVDGQTRHLSVVKSLPMQKLFR